MSTPPYLRILVIDDNPAIHQDFKNILITDKSNEAFNEINQLLFGQDKYQQSKLPAFEIDSASQGEEGVARIKQALKEGNPYALAFVDIRMPPGWDGLKTIQHIWELDKEIQIVICTAFSDYTWEETIEKLGVNDNLLILKKPFDSIAVRQLACALTRKWQLMQDVKERTNFLEKAVQERTISLEKSLSLTRATLESSYSGIIVVDKNRKVVDFNNFFIKMWDIPLVLIESKDYTAIETQILSRLEVPQSFLELANHFKASPEESKAVILKLKNGNFYECYSQAHKVEDAIVGRVWSFRDLTQRVNLENELAYQATHDPLTKLPNRVLLNDRLQQGIALAKRNNTMFAVMFIDLDRFKLINDSFNHEVGDVILKEISKRLRAVIRDEDTIARLSGDEFILVSLSVLIQNDEDIIKIVTRILNAINENVKITNREISLSASIGISIYPQDGTTPTDLIRNADLAMYSAKSLGGNQFQFYKAELNAKSLLLLEKELDMRNALINNEFFLVYQPQYDIRNKKLIAVEALIRWKHPQFGVLFPFDFIPLAENNALIVPIGEWVIRTACTQNMLWQKKGFSPFTVSVNVATKQFLQPNFVEMVKTILHETGLAPKYLEIEVTENVIINNLAIIETIKELKNHGVHFSLDDFGTGNSGLNYLRRIPVDRLKIDKTFVQKIDISYSDEVIIQAIIAMARSLNLEVIAEGVETQSQLEFLETEHCDKIQGFYFSRPITVNHLEKLLEKLP